MGVVYEIEHELTKHRRALKLLHAQFCAYPAAVARFLREASAAGRIGNEHIVETFDAGQLESGEPYIVMEQLEGETLADRLGRETELPVADISDIVGQACIGIQAAHERGIIHRDLKPENLFIEHRDGKPFVRILDFGVSKFDTALTGGLGLTGEGLALGTPFYMPPEQIRGEKNVDARSDIYALGVILYEAVTGRRPYEADTLPHLAVLIHEGNAAPIETLRPDLPDDFRDIVHRAMATEADARYATARALREALAPFTTGTASVAASDVRAQSTAESGAASSDIEVSGVGQTSMHAQSAVKTMRSAAPPRPASASGMAIASEMHPAKPEGQVDKPRGQRVAWMAAAAVAAVIGTWQWIGKSHAPAAPAASAPSAVTVAPIPADVPSVVAMPDAAVAAPSSPPLIVSAPAVVSKSNATPHSAPSPHAGPHPASRAEQKGLANENPFR
jgi:serine/threonine-protein kinase